jgi:hypothetical protein
MQTDAPTPWCRSKILHSLLVTLWYESPVTEVESEKVLMQVTDGLRTRNRDSGHLDMCSHMDRMWVLSFCFVWNSPIVNGLFLVLACRSTCQAAVFKYSTDIIDHPSILFWWFRLWIVVYMPSPQVYQVHLSPVPPFSTKMTIVSNDPTWWPTINSYRFSSYAIGSLRAVGCWSWCLDLTLTAVSQLPPLSWWCMIGVSMIRF